MATVPRFKSDTTNSIFGSFLYDQVVPQDHFLRVAKDQVDWELFTTRCLRWYRGSGTDGRPPYNPAVLLRMLLVSYLYGLSERRTEGAVNDTLSMKYFVGLGVDEVAPDHSSLTRFKDRLLAGAGQTAYDSLLRDILREAGRLGISFGSIQLVDAVHSLANVNLDQDRQRKKAGQPPRDPDAGHGVKRVKVIRDASGVKRRIPDRFYGYKAHVSANAETRLVTSLQTTSGAVYDGHHFEPLVTKDRFTPGLPTDRTYSADKAYDTLDNHGTLEERKLHDALILNDYRTQKKDPNKQRWLTLEGTPEYQAGTQQRGRIEAIFGSWKTSHGFRRCRSVGLAAFGVQARLTALAWNLQVVVAHLTGSTRRGYAYAGVGVRLPSP